MEYQELLWVLGINNSAAGRVNDKSLRVGRKIKTNLVLLQRKIQIKS